jgi:hypothetical protein
MLHLLIIEAPGHSENSPSSLNLPFNRKKEEEGEFKNMAVKIFNTGDVSNTRIQVEGSVR